MERLLESMLQHAARFRTPELHLEPRGDRLSVGRVVKGEIGTGTTMPRTFLRSLSSVIDERLEGGRLQVAVDGRMVQFEVVRQGEKIVLRLVGARAAPD